MKKTTLVLLLFLSLIFLSACGANEQAKKKITPFSFTNQEAQPFGLNELTDSIWIADFIFTKCETVCQPMTSEMAFLQKKFDDEGIQVEFVSFTVDPSVDSPKVLKSYVEDFTSDLSNWHLLTGYSQDEIEIFAREQFQTIVQKPKSANQVIHGTNFYLIDQQGVLINEYNYFDDTYVDEMIKDIKYLLN